MEGPTSEVFAGLWVHLLGCARVSRVCVCVGKGTFCVGLWLNQPQILTYNAQGQGVSPGKRMAAVLTHNRNIAGRVGAHREGWKGPVSLAGLQSPHPSARHNQAQAGAWSCPLIRSIFNFNCLPEKEAAAARESRSHIPTSRKGALRWGLAWPARGPPASPTSEVRFANLKPSRCTPVCKGLIFFFLKQKQKNQGLPPHPIFSLLFSFCNIIRRSFDIYKITKDYPHLLEMGLTPGRNQPAPQGCQLSNTSPPALLFLLPESPPCPPLSSGRWQQTNDRAAGRSWGWVCG